MIRNGRIMTRQTGSLFRNTRFMNRKTGSFFRNTRFMNRKTGSLTSSGTVYLTTRNDTPPDDVLSSHISNTSPRGGTLYSLTFKFLSVSLLSAVLSCALCAQFFPQNIIPSPFPQFVNITFSSDFAVTFGPFITNWVKNFLCFQSLIELKNLFSLQCNQFSQSSYI